jgi:peptidoglycan/LPS O-acetylase OafA/YrhL
LSGFCMAIGYNEIFSTFSIKKYINFLKKRLLKLYPLYVLSGLVILLILDIPRDGIQAVYSFIVCYLPMLQTWGIIKLIPSGIGVGWFISAIFFCYILTPFILTFLNKIKNIRFHILFCIINYLILFIFSLYLAIHNDMQNEFLYRFPVIRIFEYMIGIDFGLIYIKILKEKMNGNISYTIKSIIDMFFVLLFIFCIYGLPNNLLTRHSFAMPLFCCFMLYLCYEKRSIFYDFLNSKFCIFIGNISYECFLIHYIVLELLNPYYQKYIYTKHDLLLLFLSLLIISILLSYIYRVIQDRISQIFTTNKKNA